MQKKVWLWTVLVFSAIPGFGQIQKGCESWVLPTDNVTMAEVNPSLTAIDDSRGVSSSQLLLKTYRTINANFNWGIEAPLARYESPEKSVSGLGDILGNVTWSTFSNVTQVGYGVKMEMFLPTATDKLLGSGQLQASPSVFVWRRFSSGIYVAGGYKHYVSLLGDHARDEIDMGRFRVNVSYLHPANWWVQTNWYYHQNFRQSGKMEFIPEMEIGTLVNPGTALYLVGSTHAGGNMHSKDWTLGVGFKILYL